MAGLGDYEIREGRDGNVGVYLRKYNVRCATFAPGSEALQDLLKELIWNAQDPALKLSGLRAELADARLERDGVASLNSSLIAERDRLQELLDARLPPVDDVRSGEKQREDQ